MAEIAVYIGPTCHPCPWRGPAAAAVRVVGDEREIDRSRPHGLACGEPESGAEEIGKTGAARVEQSRVSLGHMEAEDPVARGIEVDTGRLTPAHVERVLRFDAEWEEKHPHQKTYRSFHTLSLVNVKLQV